MCWLPMSVSNRGLKVVVGCNNTWSCGHVRVCVCVRERERERETERERERERESESLFNSFCLDD
jgi:hypothetical protein